MNQGKPNQNGSHEKYPARLEREIGRQRREKRGKESRREDKGGQIKEGESGKNLLGSQAKRYALNRGEIQTGLRLLQGNIQNRKTM